MCCINLENKILDLIDKKIIDFPIRDSKKECPNTSIINVKDIKKKVCWGNDKYKFLEKTIWDEKKEICVALGFNPTNNKIDKIDSTNKKIIKQLKEPFGGYYLINLYPQRSDSKNGFDESDEIGKNYNRCIPKMLDLLIKNDIKLLIFFGRTVAIREEIIKKLDIFKNNGKLMITVKKGFTDFYHPARVEIDIIDVKKDYYDQTYHIVGVKNKD